MSANRFRLEDLQQLNALISSLEYSSQTLAEVSNRMSQAVRGAGAYFDGPNYTRFLDRWETSSKGINLFLADAPGAIAYLKQVRDMAAALLQLRPH